MIRKTSPREIRRHQWSALNVLLLWSAADRDFDNMDCGRVRARPDSDRGRSSNVRPRCSRHGVGVVEGCVAIQRYSVSRRFGSVDPQSGIRHATLGRTFQRACPRTTFESRDRRQRICEWIGDFVRPDDSVGVAPVAPGLMNNQDRAGIPDAYPDRCWEVLDTIDLEEAFQWRCSKFQNCPYNVRGRFRQVARHAFEARSHTVGIQDRRGDVRGWKLFCLLPMFFLRRSSSDGKVSEEEVCHKFNLFTTGEWGRLWHEFNHNSSRTISDIWPTWTKDGGAESSGSVS